MQTKMNSTLINIDIFENLCDVCDDHTIVKLILTCKQFCNYYYSIENNILKKRKTFYGYTLPKRLIELRFIEDEETFLKFFVYKYYPIEFYKYYVYDIYQKFFNGNYVNFWSQMSEYILNVKSVGLTEYINTADDNIKYLLYYQDHIDWTVISSKFLTEYMMIRLKNKLNWKYVLESNDVTTEFLNNNFDIFEQYFDTIICNQILTEDFLQEHIEFIKKYKIMQLILENQELSENFLEENIEYIKNNYLFYTLLIEQNVSQQFILRHIQYIRDNNLLNVVYDVHGIEYLI